MGLSTSLFLIAVGAILRFAVTVTTRGFDLHTIGLILIIVGILGLLISAFWMTLATDRRRSTRTVGPPDAPARDTERY